MSKIKVIRTNKNFTMHQIAERKRGRGAKFQWNSTCTYVITAHKANIESKRFKTFDEADKEWVYLILMFS